MSILPLGFLIILPIFNLVSGALLTSCTPGLDGRQTPTANNRISPLTATSPKPQNRVSIPTDSSLAQAPVAPTPSVGNALSQLLATGQCSGCNLAGVDLEKADLRGVDLSNANLVRADLEEVNLSGANLRGADLTGADLERANLSGANLRGANLPGADLEDAIFTGADVTGANFTGAKLKGVIGLSQ